eukprot:CAMPEP_0116862586 /NCGR_PEP_ID=MMETSP0418-20121206/23719_1 /TAXON_ID=1158023 /ORGANISM="Astrosyne radiata, Strain 13vi08-1A" /LENGTH=424 /DNA_ID=CAMNT_0004497453 /DNA_START=96 /DNA_END=1370 /DNA_ORIENTATION=+
MTLLLNIIFMDVAVRCLSSSLALIPGNGHWIGSLVTIEALQKKGYHVRVFAGRDMPLPPAEFDARALLAILNGEKEPTPSIPSKEVNYTRIQRLGNDLGFWKTVDTFSHRLHRNPKLSRPLAILSDADLIGVLQAWWHGIPSLYMTHGQVFVDTPPPNFLTKKQKRAWKWEAKVNGINSVLANYAVGFNHVPMKDTVRVSVRKEIQDMALTRHGLLQYEASRTKRRNPLVATYFRDANGGVVIETLVKAGMDVVIFGGMDVKVPLDAKGKIVQVHNAAYFVAFMGIADGIVASAGCQLVAECVHAQIPMLALYKQADSEHELNVLMAKRLAYKDGGRLLYGTTFESLAGAELPKEVKLFVEQVQSSRVSAHFYPFAAAENVTLPVIENYRNPLEEGTPEHLTKVFDILDQIKSKNRQCANFYGK